MTLESQTPYDRKDGASAATLQIECSSEKVAEGDPKPTGSQQGANRPASPDHPGHEMSRGCIRTYQQSPVRKSIAERLNIILPAQDLI
jgi:hypothetical protein